MKLLSPTPQKRINELIGLLLLSLGLLVLLSLASYHTQDPSWNTAAAVRPLNLIGYPGACVADLLLQCFGIGAFLFPALLFMLSWKWIRSEEVAAGAVKLFGTVLWLLSLTAAVSFAPRLSLFGGAIPIGGLLGMVLARYLIHALNTTGAILLTITTLIVSVYLVSSFTMSKLARWFAGPLRYLGMLADAWRAWRAERRQRKQEKARLAAERRREERRTEKESQRTVRMVARQAPPEDAPADSPAEAPREAERHSHLPARGFRSSERRAGTDRTAGPPPGAGAEFPHDAGPLPAALHRLAQRGAGPQPLRRAGAEGHRGPHQIEIRRIQRAGRRWCRSTPARWSPPSNSSPKPASSTAASPR